MAPAGKSACCNNALEILALKLKICVILSKFLELSVSVSLSLKYWLLVCNYFLKAKLEKHHPPYSDAIQFPRRGSTWTNLKGHYDIFYLGIQLTILGRLLWILPPVEEQDHSLRHWVSHSLCLWIYVSLHSSWDCRDTEGVNHSRCSDEPSLLSLEVSQEGSKMQKLRVIWQDCP